MHRAWVGVVVVLAILGVVWVSRAGRTADSEESGGSGAGGGASARPHGFYLLIGISGRANAERIFAALAENGSVKMPLQKTFWSPGFGVVVDRFGVPWEVSCESAPAT